MRPFRLPAAGLLLGALVVAAGCAAHTQPSSEGLVLPVGDVDAGHRAFQDLRCYTCHAVENDPDMPLPVSTNPGPPVGAMGPGETREHLALSIIAPSHEMPPPRESSMSHMGSFAEAMTVQQLIDVTAWLETRQATR